MKPKLLLSILALATFVAPIPSGLAQGRIVFQNSWVTPLRIAEGSITNVVLGSPSIPYFGFGPGSARIQLFAGLTSSSLSPVLIGSAANQQYVTNMAVPDVALFQGVFLGGNPLTLAGFDGSQPVFLQFTAITMTEDPFIYYGTSPIIQVNLATGLDDPTEVFSTIADASHWDGLLLTRPIPEPSTGALLALGAGALTVFRSRRE